MVRNLRGLQGTVSVVVQRAEEACGSDLLLQGATNTLLSMLSILDPAGVPSELFTRFHQTAKLRTRRRRAKAAAKGVTRQCSLPEPSASSGSQLFSNAKLFRKAASVLLDAGLRLVSGELTAQTITLVAYIYLSKHGHPWSG